MAQKRLDERDWRAGLLILLFAWVVSLLAPVQLIIEPLPPAFRIALLPMAGILGLLLASSVGLRIAARNSREGLIVPLLVGLAVALPILFLDRGSIGPAGVETLTARLIYFPFRSLNEEIVYRLGAMSLFAWLLLRTRLGRGAAGKGAAFLLAAMLAQALNCAVNIPWPQIESETAYVAIRFFAPGVLWGCLYWRFGFAAAALGHMAGHFWLQPLATLLGDRALF